MGLLDLFQDIMTDRRIWVIIWGNHSPIVQCHWRRKQTRQYHCRYLAGRCTWETVSPHKKSSHKEMLSIQTERSNYLSSTHINLVVHHHHTFLHFHFSTQENLITNPTSQHLMLRVAGLDTTPGSRGRWKRNSNRYSLVGFFLADNSEQQLSGALESSWVAEIIASGLLSHLWALPNQSVGSWKQWGPSTRMYSQSLQGFLAVDY